ncbi:MAG: hypothetical protein E7365_06525 [Clostridiales bacterium]|nr:hypothetical protein [Clostridiales bacterium]
MKKLVVVLTIVAVLVCSMFSVSAATKDDLIAKLGEIPAAKNESFYEGAVKMIKDSDLTAEQIDKLIPLLEEAKTILPKNEGASARDYTKEQRDKIFDILDRGCEITGYSYEVVTYENGKDFGIKLYAPDKSVALEYTDGIIKATGVEDANNSAYIYLAAAIVVLALAGAFVVVRKKVNG